MNNIELFIYKKDTLNEIIECEHFILCSTGDIIITIRNEKETTERTIKREEYNYFGAWGK